MSAELAQTARRAAKLIPFTTTWSGSLCGGTTIPPGHMQNV